MTDVRHSPFPAGQTASTRAADTRLSLFVSVFLLSLIAPLILDLGPVRLATYRVVLAITFIPSVIRLLSGKAGPIILADWFTVLMIFWILLSNLILMGPSASVEPTGVLTLEIVGTYLLARCYIRTPEQFYKVCAILFWIVMLLLPFALLETTSGRNVYLNLWSKLGTTSADVFVPQRLGLDRVQGPFDHPIHFGVFCAPVFGLTYCVLTYGRPFILRAIAAGATFFTGFFALSSGPISAFTIQICVLSWDGILKAFRDRWKVFAVLFVIGYVALDLAANRSPIEVIISRLALNPGTGYGRIIIWEWGWVNIFNNPVLGLGPRLLEWERLPWMQTTFDMFWLLFPMQYGIMAGVGHLGAFFAIMIAVIRKPITDPRLRSYRMGWITACIGLFLTGWMVHFWNSPFAFYGFILGSGSWLLTVTDGALDNDIGADDTPANTRARYTRFAGGTAASHARPPAPPRATPSVTAAEAPSDTRHSRSFQKSRPARPKLRR